MWNPIVCSHIFSEALGTLSMEENTNAKLQKDSSDEGTLKQEVLK